MEINRKREFLIKHRIIGIDTSIFIYFIEQHPSYFQYCNRVFKLIEENRLQAVTPTLTLLEILVQPYRLKDENLVLSFYSLFTTYPHLRWVELTLDISDLAARLRAEHGLKTPDK
jgi:predicted nucleic acid-binding protein